MRFWSAFCSEGRLARLISMEFEVIIIIITIIINNNNSIKPSVWKYEKCAHNFSVLIWANNR